MFLVGILTWWYGEGWRDRLDLMRSRLVRTADFFSVGLMLRTLFSPFRQISAGGVHGSMADQLRAFADKTVSRLVGAIARLCMVLAAVIIMFVQLIFIVVVMLMWPIVPLFPIVGLVMMILGWVPVWQL